MRKNKTCEISIMSFLNASSSQLPMEEVVPLAAAVQGLTRSSILTARRRVRIAPQTGVNYGTATASSTGGPGGAGNNQIQFLIADQGGLVDPSSVSVVYNIRTSGTGSEIPQDGHPFTRLQCTLNGSMLDDIQQAAKLTNVEARLGGSQTWYRTSGSFQGFEMLNSELNNGNLTAAAPTTATVTAYSGAWADVSNNLAAISGRTNSSAGSTTYNPLQGEQRAIPLGLLTGVGRMKQYLPLSVLGELTLTLFTGDKSTVVFQNGATADGDYSLSGVFLEYDVVVGHPSYMELLAKVANDPADQGIVLPFESTIASSSGTIAASSAALVENSIVVSRATNHLLRAMLVQQPTALFATNNYPIQACFPHCGTYSVQWRVGSMYYPQVPAIGDASLWMMTQLAYGSTNQEAASCINREQWRQTTAVTAGTAGATATEGNVKFCYADSFIPAYGFQTVKGDAEPLLVDGISLSGASGSQLVCVVQNSPSVTVTPTVFLVALRFIQCQGGAVRIQGA